MRFLSMKYLILVAFSFWGFFFLFTHKILSSATNNKNNSNRSSNNLLYQQQEAAKAQFFRSSKLNRQQAETICEPLLVSSSSISTTHSDKEQCLHHVLHMNNVETAKHYVRLLQDAQKLQQQALEAAAATQQKQSGAGFQPPTKKKKKKTNPFQQKKKAAPKAAPKGGDDDVAESNAEFEMLGLEGAERPGHEPAVPNSEIKKHAAQLVAHDTKISLHDAQVACARAIEKDTCIHDVMGIGDIKYANMYEQIGDDDITLREKEKHGDSGGKTIVHHHKPMTQKQAETACRPIIDPHDKKHCLNHVMAMNDKTIAEHYVHLLQDAELLADESGHDKSANNAVVHEESAHSLCSMAFPDDNTLQEKCENEVITFPNIHIAEHYIQLLKGMHGDSTSLVDQHDAEKLCNHVGQDKFLTCVQETMKLNAKDAATNYFNYFDLLQHEQQQDEQEE